MNLEPILIQIAIQILKVFFLTQDISFNYILLFDKSLV